MRVSHVDAKLSSSSPIPNGHKEGKGFDATLTYNLNDDVALVSGVKRIIVRGDNHTIQKEYVAPQSGYAAPGEQSGVRITPMRAWAAYVGADYTLRRVEDWSVGLSARVGLARTNDVEVDVADWGTIKALKGGADFYYSVGAFARYDFDKLYAYGSYSYDDFGRYKSTADPRRLGTISGYALRTQSISLGLGREF
jgi:hypothetical protein